MKQSLPEFPIYVPSKGRPEHCLTAELFAAEGLPFHLVIEPQDADNYARFGAHRLILPENDKGLVFARNWIKKHSLAQGDARHWQFDDDIDYMSRRMGALRIRCSASAALRAAEAFVERYENIALASFNSEFLITNKTNDPPFYLNHRCYTCFLMLNSLPNVWRNRYNEDTDMTLQVLADGWCTVLFNAFLIKTETTMTTKGGNTTIYTNDGRLRMARSLERMWPGVVSVKRRFKRPQHKVAREWRMFDNRLRRKEGANIPKGPDNFGMELIAVSKVKSPDLKKLLARSREK